jgi:hypothetical protein
MVSFRDAFWPAIAAGAMQYADVEDDSVHPNDRGHAAVAGFIGALLEKVRRGMPSDDRLPSIALLPAPLLTDCYAHVALYEGENLTPTSNDGWMLDREHHCWTSEQPGSAVEFVIPGRRLFWMDWHHNADMGRVAVSIDGRPPLIHDAWFQQTWGGYRDTFELARDLAGGLHRVRVTLLSESNPHSRGHKFCIMGLGSAGVAPEVAGRMR